MNEVELTNYDLAIRQNQLHIMFLVREDMVREFEEFCKENLVAVDPIIRLSEAMKKAREEENKNNDDKQ